MAVVGDFIATARVEGGSNIYNPLIAIAIATATAIATEIQPTICFNFYRHTNKWCIWRLQGNMSAFDIYTFLQQLQLQVDMYEPIKHIIKSFELYFIPVGHFSHIYSCI
ncbi:hypothetical protein GQX74_012923 [Glossina fuscipes]|nr:hypothetical protein GQX74_012923 [Glossina fuscipes]